jgi:hypothetical protein
METCILAAVTGMFLAALVFLSPDPAWSGETGSGGAACTCPDADRRAVKPKFADFGLGLDESDEIAALESIDLGLSQMDDGNPFVWRRPNGRLSGIVRPTVSFRNAGGAVCRHVIVLLTTGYRTATAEGVACRLPNRRWVLEG